MPGIKHEARFERESGSFRPIVKDVVEKYLGPCLPDVADARQRLAGLEGT